ncbi:PIN domain-containing protein [Terracidiphilus gabretensis]|uniref:PIN domain-containing protein n=1 Tax=Terracidiphilus gabretensis TaxID=1577687 RepID=UPI00071B1607|nr:PIN domain-containing protein [Terracidiphilus gabretensis]
MGLVLDSSILIPAERKGMNAYQALAELARLAAGEQLAISVITIAELAHGIARSNSPERATIRRQFLNELSLALPVQPVAAEIALRAGLMDGDRTARGIRIPFSDLLIGVTALELGYKVATENMRHFQLIPDLSIVSF